MIHTSRGGDSRSAGSCLHPIPSTSPALHWQEPAGLSSFQENVHVCSPYLRQCTARFTHPIFRRHAVARRDRLIEKLASLTPVHGALDQIVQRFGTDMVAEVTGRSRRIVRKRGADGIDRLVVENRAGSANLGETQAFMDDAKRILVFSDAGGTGRSYHADLAARNRRLRVHY